MLLDSDAPAAQAEVADRTAAPMRIARLEAWWVRIPIEARRQHRSDFGQVTTGPLGPDDFAQVLWAVGIGVRYLTAIGPIRLDLARRLPFGRLPPLFAQDLNGQIVPRNYEPNDACFGIGGSGRPTPVNDGLCVLHISIGEAF